MTIEAIQKNLIQLERELYAYQHALALLEVDGETAAPRDSAEGRGVAMSLLSEKKYALLTGESTKALLAELENKSDQLDEALRRKAQLLKEDVEDLTRIPAEEYAAYAKVVNEASSKWLEAKEQNRYALFEPLLSQVVDYNRRFAAYHNPNAAAYDDLLDQYEKGMSMAVLDPLFEMLRSELEIRPSPFAKLQLPECTVPQQQAFAHDLMRIMGIDPNRCTLTVTEHPFTQGFNPHDVRITTHYDTQDVFSSTYSVIHEGGHALYELNLPEPFGAIPTGVPSMGMHESQSRFFENLVGHDPGFLRWLLPLMRKHFDFDGVSDQDLIRNANYIQPSLIRTLADEVTYPLHIMIRYELEKRLMDGSLSTRDLPEAWNAMYHEYLGVHVPDDRQGVLQDMHWAGGMIGYFPTYVLGSAYASQFMHAMRKDLDVDGLLCRGQLEPIREWLTSHVHRYGNLYRADQLLVHATGEAFNPAYYVDHLKQAADR